MKPEGWLETLNCAVEGVLHAVKTQRHMRWHTLCCLAVLILAPRFPITPSEFALLCLAAGMVIVAELANTALETAVDLACPDFHPLARAAKDVAAGAVLVAAFAAAAVGWVVLYPKLDSHAALRLEQLNDGEPVVIAAMLLSVLAVVVLLKALVGRGRPLFGGMPSGHAAVSFAIATVLTLRTEDPTVGVLTGTLALMVSHSRLLHLIHTRGEVLAGGVIGILIASILFWLIR
jgi:diacylglycerol kinase (ATP)